MRPSLAFHAARQNGLVTRHQARVAGYSDQEIRRLTRANGPWVVVRRGVYAEREHWESGGGQRPLLRALAAHLTMDRDHVLSHTSAGLLLGLPMLAPPNELIHVTRPGVTGSRTRHGVKHHLAPFTRELVTTVQGIPALNLARTAVDIGREHGYRHGLVACDAARQRGVGKEDLTAVLRSMSHWPQVNRARAAVEDSDPGAESPGETLSRELVCSLGLGDVQTQFSIQTRGRLYFVDLRVGRHLIEFDGRIKYQRAADGGVASSEPSDVLWQEKQRETLICAEGFGMSRLVWADLWGPQRQQATERIRREYALSAERFGTELPPGHRSVSRERRTA